MTSRWRVLALVVTVALLGACSGGGDDDAKKSSKSQADDSDTTLSLGSDPDDSSNTVAGASGGTTTGKAGATTTTAKGGASATTSKPVAAPPTAGGEAAPAPAANGTYTYSQSGTTPDGPVPATGTLVVNGSSFARYYDQSKQPQRLTYTFGNSGPFITGASLSFSGATATCTFSNPLAAPSWPPTPGATDSASGTCNTLAGTLTVVANSRVNSRSGDIVNFSTTIHAYNASRSIDVTANDVEGWSISLRVPKTSRQTFSGTAFNNPVSGDVSSTLTGTP